MIVFFMLAYGVKRRIILFIVLSFLLLVAYYVIPSFQKVVYYTFSVFDNDSNVSGSSLEMRLKQYEAVLFYIQDNMWFGNGKRYFILDMGYLEGGKAVVDHSLEGLEGVILSLLLERGIFGLMCFFVFYIILLVKSFMYKYIDKIISASCVSIIVAFLIFSIMTGELNSVPPTLFLAGIFLRLYIFNKRIIRANK